MRRVVVTGIGVAASNGVGREAFWSACSEGVSGVRPIRAFDASAHPVRVAGEVPVADLSPFVPPANRKHLKGMSRTARLGLAAAGLAVTDSGVDFREGGLDPERVGVMIGTGVVPVDLAELGPLLARSVGADGQLDCTRMGDPGGGAAVYPAWLLKHLPNMVAAHISMAFNAQGPNNTIVTACVAGTQAIGEAFRCVARGEADVVLAGGADSRIDPLMLLGYAAIGALSPACGSPAEVSRPFDRMRDGFVIAEGAAVLVLEEYERARDRGATIYAEVCGFGSSFDAYSITRPDPTGRGGARAIQCALEEARVDHRDIDYINAHGTSTRLNDAMETAAVKRVFGEYAKTIKLSSIKSMIGHSIGAAGAIEAAALALTLHTKVLPPTINLHCPDPACDLDYIPNEARETPVTCGLSTSFGFGGQNGALVMRAA
jgi:3-oxoacyl-[acyl-carrier-protein] synthase II